jgi:hypothetical protein
MSTKFRPAAVKPQVSLEDLNKLDIREEPLNWLKRFNIPTSSFGYGLILGIIYAPFWSA